MNKSKNSKKKKERKELSMEITLSNGKFKRSNVSNEWKTTIGSNL